MKKVILVISLFVALGMSYSFVNYEACEVSNQISIENLECKYGQCTATAKSTGNRCLHCVSNAGDATCWQH